MSVRAFEGFEAGGLLDLRPYPYQISKKRMDEIIKSLAQEAMAKACRMLMYRCLRVAKRPSRHTPRRINGRLTKRRR